ncbi:tetratricopeptide repeat protein [Sphaerisporangium sp. B11E5]|uniref:tetratricopeptide repeat protein n=1 Tax=Sphaerisporangium sp. B11E5 TaxID=3153563 RepID=UPI00325D474D
MSRRSGTAGWETAGPSQVFGAVMALRNVVEGFGGDIRAQPSRRRKEFDQVVARLRGALRHPPEAFDEACAALSASTAAAACQMYVDARDETAALGLVEAARPLMERLGPRHHDVMNLRRAHAGALLAQGRREQAETLLRALLEDETRTFGRDDPRTAPTEQLLHWAHLAMGRLEEAESGLRTLRTRLTRHPHADRALLRHIECKLSWTVGRRHRLRESADGYDHVIASRAREFRPDHPDALDARHSKGKMYVLHGDGPAAHAVLSPLLPDMRRVLGPRSPYTLETRKYLALARTLTRPDDLREHRRARRVLRHVLRVQTRGPGHDHPDTRDTREWLTALSDIGKRP